jgi:nitrous oxide reductase accessory protein NosL
MVRDFYDRRERVESDLVFVAGSDVLGPMGADLVPVDRARASKFVSDHGGRALAPSAVDEAVLADLK